LEIVLATENDIVVYDEDFPTAVPNQLLVYDTSGRLIRTLPSSGGNNYLWDGLSSDGVETPAGMYTVVSGDLDNCTPAQIVKLE